MYKIVVADDNHLTIQALQATVPWEEWGFQLVGCAENGIDALSQLSLYHPDIAILDINMPGMTGLEVAKQLLESKERILFIFLTAYDEFSYAQTALQIGAFDYLLKPLDNEALKEILLRAGEKLDRERQTADMRSKLRSEYENWAGHLLLDGINGVNRSVTELEDMLQQEWRPAGYELMLISTTDFLPQERVEQLTDQIRQCLSCQETSYQFKYVHARIKEGFLILLVFKKSRLCGIMTWLPLRLPTVLWIPEELSIRICLWESVIFLREAWMPFPRFMRRRYSLQRAVFSWRIKQLSTIKVSLVKVFEMSIRSAEKCRICSVCFIRNPGILRTCWRNLSN